MYRERRVYGGEHKHVHLVLLAVVLALGDQHSTSQLH